MTMHGLQYRYNRFFNSFTTDKKDKPRINYVPFMKWTNSSRIILLAALIALFTMLQFSHKWYHTINTVNMHGRNRVKFDADERLVHISELPGGMFKSTGHYHPNRHHISTAVIHNFEDIQEAIHEKFFDSMDENKYRMNSPAMIWYKNELLVVLRIWLQNERHYDFKQVPHNLFQDNFLFCRRYDRSFNLLDRGTILGIPTPRYSSVGDGPMEPRMVKVKDDLLISFNAQIKLWHQQIVDTTLIWDYEKHNAILPIMKDGNPAMGAGINDEVPKDKHWMPFVIKDKLHYVYTLDPLRILECNVGTNMSCWFIHRADKTPQGDIPWQDWEYFLRGGTPLSEYQWPYYIGFAHTALYRVDNSRRYFTTNLFVLCVEPQYRLVYISGKIEVSDQLLNRFRVIRPLVTLDPFIFAISLILEDDDTAALGIHINDKTGAILRIKGLKDLLEDVMQIDKREGTIEGPSPGEVQSFTIGTIEAETGVKFQRKTPKITRKFLG